MGDGGYLRGMDEAGMAGMSEDGGWAAVQPPHTENGEGIGI